MVWGMLRWEVFLEASLNSWVGIRNGLYISKNMFRRAAYCLTPGRSSGTVTFPPGRNRTFGDLHIWTFALGLKIYLLTSSLKS